MGHLDWNTIILFIVAAVGATTLLLTLLRDVLIKIAELADAARRIRRSR